MRFSLALAMRVLRCFGLFVWTPSSDDPFAATRPSFFSCFVHALMRPKARRRFFYADFGSAEPLSRSVPSPNSRYFLWVLRRNDSEIGLFPLAVGGRSIRAFPFSSGVHRFLSTSNFPLCSILFFLSPCPPKFSAGCNSLMQAYRKSGIFLFALDWDFPLPFSAVIAPGKAYCPFLPVSFSCRLFFGFFLPKKVCFSSDLEIGFFGSSPADF